MGLLMYPVGQSVNCQSVVTRCSRQEHAQMDSFGVPAAHGGLLRDAEAAVVGSLPTYMVGLK